MISTVTISHYDAAGQDIGREVWDRNGRQGRIETIRLLRRYTILKRYALQRAHREF